MTKQDLRHVIGETSFPELGKIIAGLKGTREQITTADLSGTGIQLTAVARTGPSGGCRAGATRNRRAIARAESICDFRQF